MSEVLSSSNSLPGARLKRVLLSVAHQTQCDIERLSSGHAHRHIHALRVRMKKLRALLMLVEREIPQRTLEVIRQDIRFLKRAFAGDRDEAVVNDLCEKITGTRTEGPGARSPQKDVKPSREKGRQIEAAAARLTKRLQGLRLGRLVWKEAAKAFSHGYAKARRWFERCQRKPFADRMHHWRAPVKEHYYQSLCLLPEGNRCKSWRKLGSQLGKMHDLAMLEDHLQKGAQDGPLELVKAEMKRRRDRVFRLAGKLFASAPKKLKRRVLDTHSAKA